MSIGLSTDASDGVTLSNSTEKVDLELPYASSASGANSIGMGLFEYDNRNGSSTVPIVKDDGSIQIATVITDAASPTTYTYRVGGDISAIEPQDDGALILKSSSGSTIGVVAPPWAVDSDGVHLPTSYNVEGTYFTQTVVFSKDTVFPVVADPWLGVDLISSHKWYTASGKPAISVAVTPMMGAVNEFVAATVGWDELKTKVKAKSSSKYTELTTHGTYNDQWFCHSAGKTLIGVAGWLGIDKRPTWDLEGFRRRVSSPDDYISKHCNW